MLKRITTFFAIVISVSLCSAKVVQMQLVKEHDEKTTVFKALPAGQFKPEAKVFTPKQTPRFNMSEESVMHTVTLKAVYNSEEYILPWNCGIVNKEIEQFPSFDGNGEAIVQLPEGVYCASAEFGLSDATTMDRKIPRKVFVEDIVVDRDLAIELNPDMATCLVEFQPLMPDGEVMSLQQYGEFDFETWTVEIIPGNTKYMASVDVIWHEDLGALRSSGGGSNYMGDDNNIYDKWAFYITPLSDKMTILRGVVASTEDDGYLVTLMNPIKGIQSSQEGVWSTDYSCKSMISTAHTELFDNISETLWEFIPRSMLTLDLVYPNGEKFFMPIGTDSNGNGIKAAGLFSEGQLLRAAFSGAEPDAAVEYWEKNEEGNDVLTGYSYTCTLMPTFFFTEDGGQRFVSLPVDAGLIATEDWNTTFGPVNDWYSFQNTEYIGEFGGSQAIACMNWRPKYEYVFDYETFQVNVIKSNTLYNTPMGRLSELIGANNFASYATMTTLDSDKVWNDPDRTDKSRVEVQAEFSCQIIDGLMGKTEAYMYWDENNEDCYPPMLTMLQFRDAATDVVTDRFGKASDAKVLLSGNDFNVRILNEDTYPMVLFDEAPAEMKLEWRATGAAEDAEWNELELTDLNSSERGFGNMYEASLGSVDGTSSTGWFDVKISMVDEAGNNMWQTVSPAFKIMNSVSVNEINCDTKRLEYYDMQGNRVKNPCSGVYIVRSGDKVYKKIVNAK